MTARAAPLATPLHTSHLRVPHRDATLTVRGAWRRGGLNRERS